MAPEKVDSLDADSLKPLVQQLLTRIDELLAQIKAQNARIAELEAKLGQPPNTPDTPARPPARGQKANAEPVAPKLPRKGRPGVARALADNADVTRRFYAERCGCGAVLDAAGQDLAKEYDHIDIPPIRPTTTRIELFRAPWPRRQGRGGGGPPRRHARGHAVRSGHHVNRHVSARLPDGRLQAADRGLPGPVWPHDLARRHRQYARPRRLGHG